MAGREDKGVEDESHFLNTEGNYETVPNSGSPQRRPPLEREAGTSSRQREEDQAVTNGSIAKHPSRFYGNHEGYSTGVFRPEVS